VDGVGGDGWHIYMCECNSVLTLVKLRLPSYGRSLLTEEGQKRESGGVLRIGTRQAWYQMARW
jgi:hypothetical protein